MLEIWHVELLPVDGTSVQMNRVSLVPTATLMGWRIWLSVERASSWVSGFLANLINCI